MNFSPLKPNYLINTVKDIIVFKLGKFPPLFQEQQCARQLKVKQKLEISLKVLLFLN